MSNVRIMHAKARGIETHKVEGDYFSNSVIVEALGEKGNGGANFKYVIRDRTNDEVVQLTFQQGNPEEKINGTANEALLAIVIDRLQGFQDGDFPSVATDQALEKLREALGCMQVRTLDRVLSVNSKSNETKYADRITREFL